MTLIGTLVTVLTGLCRGGRAVVDQVIDLSHDTSEAQYADLCMMTSL